MGRAIQLRRSDTTVVLNKSSVDVTEAVSLHFRNLFQAPNLLIQSTCGEGCPKDAPQPFLVPGEDYELFSVSQGQVLLDLLD